MTAPIEPKQTGIRCYDDFEKKFGNKEAEDFLQRICEEHYSEGSQYGVSISERESLDRLGANYRISGSAEHRGVWYYFSIEDGNRNGTVIEDFCLDDPDIETAPAELAVPELLASCMREHLAEYAHVATAGYAAVRTLRKRFPVAKVSGATEQVHALLRGILGDLACQCEEYEEDALRIASAVMKAPDTAPSLFNALSQELQARIARTCQGNETLGMPANFLSEGLAPVFQAALV